MLRGAKLLLLAGVLAQAQLSVNDLSQPNNAEDIERGRGRYGVRMLMLSTYILEIGAIEKSGLSGQLLVNQECMSIVSCSSRSPEATHPGLNLRSAPTQTCLQHHPFSGEQ